MAGDLILALLGGVVVVVVGETVQQARLFCLTGHQTGFNLGSVLQPLLE